MGIICNVKQYRQIAGIAMFLMLITACEHKSYDLLDPASAGVWTLYDTSTGLPGNTVNAIQLDSKNNLWFSFPGHGAAEYADKVWSYYNMLPSPILSNSVTCLATDITGKMFFGTSNGLSILTTNTTGNEWASYIDPVTSMYVSTIKVASNGWIWVGTQNQGFYVNSGLGFTKTLTTQYKNVNVIEEGTQGNIYLGTDNGIIKWDGNNYSYLTTSDGLPNNKVTSLRLDKKERLWVGTDGGKTASWIDGSGVHQLNLMTGSDSVFIKSIWEDRKGDIWFATFNDGLIRFDGVIPHSYKISNGFFENKVYSIGEDKDGNLWFGLYSKGLVKYTLRIDIK
jgi:ligand-binding sensor domain-containing protein